MAATNENLNSAGLSTSVLDSIRQLTKTQTKRVLLGLVQESTQETSSNDLKQVGGDPYLLERISRHIQEVIQEDKVRASPVPDSFMEHELEAVDHLLDSYTNSADKKILNDVSAKMNDLFVILQSRVKDQKWQAEIQQRTNRLNNIRGKNFPDPTIFNTGFQKRGWMDKRTHKSTFKGWKRRWFVLKGQHLTYFAKTEASVANSDTWGEVTLEGFLRKKKQGKGWKQRWIQIRPEGILYFKSAKDKEPIGALPFSECERSENPAEKSFEVTYNGTKYYFMVENDEEFLVWSAAFAGMCPETYHDPNMAYFTIRGVIDLSTSVLDDKQNDKPHSFTLTVEGGKTYIFAVDTGRQKQDWLDLLSSVVREDNSTSSSRITRSGSTTSQSGSASVSARLARTTKRDSQNPHHSPPNPRRAKKKGSDLHLRANGQKRQSIISHVPILGRGKAKMITPSSQKEAVVNRTSSVTKILHKIRGNTISGSSANGSGSGIMKQNSFESGRNTPESPAVLRFAFKDEAIGRSLAVRSEDDNFDAKFQAEETSAGEEEEEEKEEGEEAARERTKMVRRETIKLIRTFKLEVNIEDKKEIYTFQFDNSVLVDQVKTYLFKHIPQLVGKNMADYSLGVDADDLLTVEFLRFVSSNTFIEVAVRTCGIARVGLFLRDNLRKINEERQRGARRLKNTVELTHQAEGQRADLEKSQQESERKEEKKPKATLDRSVSEKRIMDKQQNQFQSTPLLIHTPQPDGKQRQKIFITSATQTEQSDVAEKAKDTTDKDRESDKQESKEGGSTEKISWRNQLNAQLPSAKVGEGVVKSVPNVPVGTGNVTQGLTVNVNVNANGDANGASSPSSKPKTMITKTNPRSPPPAGVWQQVQPSLSATKRPMIIQCEGWSIEVPGEPLPPSAVKTWQFAISMDGSVSETPEPFFYRKHFITARKLTNFLGSDPKYGSISFSMCSSFDSIRGVLFTKLGTRQISVNPGHIKIQGPSIKSRKQQMVHYLMSKLEPNINTKNLRLSIHPDMQKELLSLEERQVCSGFKFGAVYAKNYQTDENELFNNESGSDEWNEFIDLLGTRIQLKGWTQYNAGLDVKGDTTGTHSLYTNYKGNEIMFHVSTMLPYHPDDPQKLERKRHVGNDICVIIFQEGSTPYLPSTITSHFNHIIAVVHYDKAVGGYRLAFAFKDGVPAFGPVLNSHGFVKKEDLKELLLTKLINGEAASLLAPVFAQKLVRTREALLNYYVQQFL